MGDGSHPLDDPHVVIAMTAREADAARRRLQDLLRRNCPGPHRYVQHRDHKPPWCRVCRYRVDGVPVDAA